MPNPAVCTLTTSLKALAIELSAYSTDDLYLDGTSFNISAPCSTPDPVLAR